MTPRVNSTKRLFTVLAIALIAVAVLLPQNPAFSAASTLRNHLESWMLWTEGPSAYSYGLDPEVKFHGKDCAFIKSNQPILDRPQGAIYQKFKAENYRNQRVKLSGWIRTQGVNEFAGLWMVVHGPDQATNFDNMEDRISKGDHDWKHYSLVLDVPADSRWIMIGFILHGKGEAWLSGLKFETVDKSVKTTNLPMDEMKFPMEGRYGEHPSIGFKTSTWSGGKAPANWSNKFGEGYEIVVDENERYKGQNSVRIDAIKPDPRGFATIWQTISARDYANQRWRFTGAIKTQDVSDYAALWMRVDGGGKVIKFDNMEDRPVKGTTEWKRCSVVLDIPKDSYSIRFGFLQSGSGSAWLSGCAFEKVDAEVKPTDKSMEPMEIPDTDVIPSPKLSFE